MTGASNVGTLCWFAAHEFNLAWRDFVRMMSAGKPGRERGVIGFLLIAVLSFHCIAYLLISPELLSLEKPDKPAMLTLMGMLILSFSLMMSQALELVTRVFYSRSDLDLILSSPSSEKKVFAVRIGAIAVAVTFLPALLLGSAINILAIFVSPTWLVAYPVIAAIGALTTALSLLITIALFKSMGAKRTRLVSQIVAATVGAGFIIGVQIAAIASLNSVSGLSFFQSEMMMNLSPGIEHWIWTPARAISGDGVSLILVLGLCFGALWLVTVLISGKFGHYVIAAAGVSESASRSRPRQARFSGRSIRVTLILKEWKLLLRDHWLISQTLMQVLYLAPPAYMLWQGFGGTGALASVALPVLVMATGQLAGGLAWLAISGEDAPQLVQTAPIAKGAVIRAKIEAILYAIGILTLPIIALIGLMDLRLMLIAMLGVAAGSVSATMIQLWFRSQANRASFRRRQTSSKIATLAEAFSSIMWAGATGLAAASMWLFMLITVGFAIAVLWTARKFRPEQDY